MSVELTKCMRCDRTSADGVDIIGNLTTFWPGGLYGHQNPTLCRPCIGAIRRFADTRAPHVLAIGAQVVLAGDVLVKSGVTIREGAGGTIVSKGNSEYDWVVYFGGPDGFQIIPSVCLAIS